MAGDFTTQDILDELDRLQPKEVNIVRQGSFVSGDDYVLGLKDAVHRTFNGDPDSLFDLMLLKAQDISKNTATVRAALEALPGALRFARTRPVTVDEDKLDELILSLENMAGEPPQVQDREIARYTVLLTQYLNSSKTPSGQKKIAKSVDSVVAEALSSIEEVDRLLPIIEEDHAAFDGAVAEYLGSDSGVYSVERQIQTIKTCLEEARDGVTDINQSVVTASIGESLLRERRTSRDPTDPKYDGPIEVLPGTPAQLTGYSLPAPVAATVVPTFDVDASTGHVTVPASSSPNTLRGFIQDSSIFPYAGGTTLSILQENSIRSVALVGPILNRAVLAAALDTALDPYGIYVTSTTVSGVDVIDITSTSVGTGSRLMFWFGTANDDFSFLPSLYAEERGTDTTIEDVSPGGALPPEVSAPFAVVEADVASTATSVFPDRLSIPAGLDVQVGDTISVKTEPVASYTVVGVTPTYVTLSSDVLRPVNLSTEVVTAVASMTFDVIRAPLTVTSPTNTQGSALEATSSLFGFVAGTEATGSFSSFVLTNGAGVGSPIRRNDKVYDQSGALIGDVLLFSDDTVTIGPNTGLHTATAATIHALGSTSFSDLAVARSDVTRAFTDAPESGELRNNVVSLLGSRSGRARVDSNLADLNTLVSALEDAYNPYRANTVKGLRQLLQVLAEEKLNKPRALLVSLAFSDVFNLTAEGMSDRTELENLMETLSTELGGNVDLVFETEGESFLTDYSAASENRLIEFPASDDLL